MRIVFGLDGVLAGGRDRRTGSPAGWGEFHDECHSDRVLWPVASLYRMLWAEGHDVEVWTVRPMTHLEMTVKWFSKRSLPLGVIKMAREDEPPDYTTKRAMLKADGGSPPDMVVCRCPLEAHMWLTEKVLCLQVSNWGN